MSNESIPVKVIEIPQSVIDGLPYSFPIIEHGDHQKKRNIYDKIYQDCVNSNILINDNLFRLEDKTLIDVDPLKIDIVKLLDISIFKGLMSINIRNDINTILTSLLTTEFINITPEQENSVTVVKNIPEPTFDYTFNLFWKIIHLVRYGDKDDITIRSTDSIKKYINKKQISYVKTHIETYLSHVKHILQNSEIADDIEDINKMCYHIIGKGREFYKGACMVPSIMIYLNDQANDFEVFLNT